MRYAVHQPPADDVVDALVRAGVSRQTALAMERHKAEETLELLNPLRGMAHGMLAEGGRAALPRGTL